MEVAGGLCGRGSDDMEEGGPAGKENASLE